MRYINRDGGTPSLITGSFLMEQAPEQETIDEASAEYLDFLNKQGDYAITDYIWNRKNTAPCYAPANDQLAMQYRDLVGGTTEWADHRAAVEAAWPGP